MAELFDIGIFSVEDTDGSVGAGWKLNFYATGTSTRQDTYPTEADADAGTNANTNPVVADAAGRFPPIWLKTTGNVYKAVLTTASDVVKATKDPALFSLARALNSTDAGNGAARIGFSAGSGAVADTVQAILRLNAINVMSYIPVAERAAITAGTSTTNVRSYIQTALDAHLTVYFPDGLFRIESALTLRDGHTVQLSAGTTVRQYTAGQSAFTVTAKSNVWMFLNGGAIRGPGGWDDAWVGNSGHEGYRGIRFLGCTTSGVIGPGRVFNWGNAAIEFAGGSAARVEGVKLEGTDGYTGSDTITSLANFQQLIYFSDSATYGATNHAHVVNCELSGSCQGVLREGQLVNAAATSPTFILGCNFHDIPGQHGIYNQERLLTVADCQFRTLGGSAVKNQAADAGENLDGITATGINATSIGGSLFEVAEIGGFGGSIQDIRLEGGGTNCGYLVTLTGKIEGAEIDVMGSTTTATGNAVYAQGADMKRVRVRVDCEGVGQDGILITATNSSIDLWPNIRSVNSGNAVADAAGLRVNSASATVRVFNGSFINGDALMEHGVLNVTAGSSIEFIGIPTISGNTGAAINNSGTLKGDIPQGSATYNPGSLADGAGETTTVTVAGAALGDFARASFSLDLQGIMLTAWVSAANTVSVRFQNETTGVIDLAEGTLRARVVKV